MARRAWRRLAGPACAGAAQHQAQEWCTGPAEQRGCAWDQRKEKKLHAAGRGATAAVPVAEEEKQSRAAWVERQTGFYFLFSGPGLRYTDPTLQPWLRLFEHEAPT